MYRDISARLHKDVLLTLPLAAGLAIAPPVVGDVHCLPAASRIISAPATTDQFLDTASAGWAGAVFDVLQVFLTGFVIMSALVVRQASSRICPLLFFACELKNADLPIGVKASCR